MDSNEEHVDVWDVNTVTAFGEALAPCPQWVAVDRARQMWAYRRRPSDAPLRPIFCPSMMPVSLRLAECIMGVLSFTFARAAAA
jgi:hypothetical protein